MPLPPKTLPLYVQIAEGLIDRIESGELAPGDRLPPERILSSSLGVTRVTLRQALQLVEAEGLLERRQGAGTFIAAPKIERTTTRLTPFTLGMKRSGLIPGARVVQFERKPAKISTARRLKLPLSSELYYCHRLRLINQEPIMVEKFYLPASSFPDLDAAVLEDASVFEILEQGYGVRIIRAEQSLEAVSASDYEAELLGITAGAPLLLERRVSYDTGGRPVEYAKDLYRGDRFKFLLDTDID